MSELVKRFVQNGSVLANFHRKYLNALPEISSNVTHLDLSKNELTLVDLSRLPNLVVLDLSVNSLKLFPDLRNHVHLKCLSLSENFVEVVDYTMLPPNLEELYLVDFGLESMPSNEELPKSLRLLDCSMNHFAGKVVVPETLETAIFEEDRITHFDATNARNLKVANLKFNNLRVVEPNEMIEELNMEFNSNLELPKGVYPRLRKLRITCSSFKDRTLRLPDHNFPALEEVYATSCCISRIECVPKGLKHLDLFANDIDRETLKNVPEGCVVILEDYQ